LAQVRSTSAKWVVSLRGRLKLWSSLVAMLTKCFLLLTTTMRFASAAAVDKAAAKDCRCWAVQGQCKDNARFMSKNCEATCSWHVERESAVQNLAALNSRISECQVEVVQLKAEADTKCSADSVAMSIPVCQREVKRLKAEVNSSKASVHTAANQTQALQAIVADLELKLTQKSSTETTAASQRVVELEDAQKKLNIELASARSAVKAAANKSLLLEAEVVGLRAETAQKEVAVIGDAVTSPRISELEAKIKKQETDTATARIAVEMMTGRANQAFESRILALQAQSTEKELAFNAANDLAAKQKMELQEEVEMLRKSMRRHKLEKQLDHDSTNTTKALPTGANVSKAFSTESSSKVSLCISQLENEQDRVRAEKGIAEDAVKKTLSLETHVSQIQTELDHSREAELNMTNKNTALQKQLVNRNRAVQLTQKFSPPPGTPAHPLEAEVTRLKKLVESATAAQVSTSNQSDTFESRVLELENQLAALTVEGSNGSAEVDPWIEFQEQMRHAPRHIRKWFAELPESIRQEIVSTFKDVKNVTLDTMSLMADDTMQRARAAQHVAIGAHRAAVQYVREILAECTYSNFHMQVLVVDEIARTAFKNLSKKLLALRETAYTKLQSSHLKSLAVCLSLFACLCHFYLYHFLLARRQLSGEAEPRLAMQCDTNAPAAQQENDGGCLQDAAPVSMRGRKRPSPLIDISAAPDMEQEKSGTCSAHEEPAPQGSKVWLRLGCMACLTCTVCLTCMGCLLVTEFPEWHQCCEAFDRSAVEVSKHVAISWQHLQSVAAVVGSRACFVATPCVEQILWTLRSVRHSSRDSRIGQVLVIMQAVSILVCAVAVRSLLLPNLLLTACVAAVAVASAAAVLWRKREEVRAAAVAVNATAVKQAAVKHVAVKNAAVKKMAEDKVMGKDVVKDAQSPCPVFNMADEDEDEQDEDDQVLGSRTWQPTIISQAAGSSVRSFAFVPLVLMRMFCSCCLVASVYLGFLGHASTHQVSEHFGIAAIERSILATSNTVIGAALECYVDQRCQAGCQGVAASAAVLAFLCLGYKSSSLRASATKALRIGLCSNSGVAGTKIVSKADAIDDAILGSDCAKSMVVQSPAGAVVVMGMSV